MKKAREPKQKRSIEKKKRIMETAKRLFSKKGIFGTNSNEIAADAGVSIGTFYSYFEDKKSLLLEVLKLHLDRFTEEVFSGQDNIDARSGHDEIWSRIYTILVRVFKAFNNDPEFHRETLILKFSDPDVKRIYDEAENKEMQFIISFFEEYSEKIEKRDLKAAAKIIYCAVENVAHSVKFLDSPLEEERLIHELTDMIYKYLFVGPVP